MLQALRGSQWHSLQLLHLEGHIFYSFLRLQRQAGMAGGGAEGGKQLHLSRELQLLLQMAPESPL